MMRTDPVIDATRAEVSAFGVRRATMTSIARRAGISRATLYRRATSLEALVQDALVAEFEQALATALPVDDEVSRQDIVAGARALLVQLAESPLTHALIAHDPELLLPYLVDRLGRSQELVLTVLETAVRAAQAGGSVRAGEARILALGSLQALTSFVVGLRLLESVAPRQTWFDEAARLLDRYLRPDEENPS